MDIDESSSYCTAEDEWIWHSAPSPSEGHETKDEKKKEIDDYFYCCSSSLDDDDSSSCSNEDEWIWQSSPSPSEDHKMRKKEHEYDIDCSSSLCEDDSLYWIGENEWFLSSESILDSDISVGDCEAYGDHTCGNASSSCHDSEYENDVPPKEPTAYMLLHHVFKTDQEDCDVPAMKPCANDSMSTSRSNLDFLGLTIINVMLSRSELS